MKNSLSQSYSFEGIAEAARFANLTPADRYSEMVRRIVYLEGRAKIADQFVPELSPLEQEVDELVSGKTKPAQFYKTRKADSKLRPGKKMDAVEFLREHYGKYLVKGEEAMFQADLLKVDPPLLKALYKYCDVHLDAGNVGGHIPARMTRTKRARAPGQGGCEGSGSSSESGVSQLR